MLEVYKLSTGVWKDITHVAPSYKFYKQKPGVCVNGASHCVAIKSKQGEFPNAMIVLFDVHDETFMEMMVPGSLAEMFLYYLDWFNLFVSEEALCLDDHLFDKDKTINIVRMKEHGDLESCG